MYFNDGITRAMHRLARCCRRKKSYKEIVLSETRPLLQTNGIKTNNTVFDQELTLKDCEDFGKIFSNNCLIIYLIYVCFRGIYKYMGMAKGRIKRGKVLVVIYVAYIVCIVYDNTRLQKIS